MPSERTERKPDKKRLWNLMVPGLALRALAATATHGAAGDRIRLT